MPLLIICEEGKQQYSTVRGIWAISLGKWLSDRVWRYTATPVRTLQLLHWRLEHQQNYVSFLLQHHDVCLLFLPNHLAANLWALSKQINPSSATSYFNTNIKTQPTFRSRDTWRWAITLSRIVCTLLWTSLTLRHVSAISSPLSSRLITSNFTSLLIDFRRFFTWIALSDADWRFSLILVRKAKAVAEEIKWYEWL